MLYRVYLQTCHLLRHRLKVTIFETINIFGLLLWISSRNVARSLNFVVVKFEQSSICKTMIYPTTLKPVFGLVTRLQIDPVNYTVILQNDRFLIRVKKKFVDSLWKLLKFWLFFRSIPPLKKNLPIIFISAIFGFVSAEIKDR